MLEPMVRYCELSAIPGLATPLLLGFRIFSAGKILKPPPPQAFGVKP